MANVTLSSAFDFTSDQDWEWTTTGASASLITITSNTYRQTFSGTFSYDSNDNVSGTANGTNFYINSGLVYSITNMGASAAQLSIFADTFGDTQATYAYVLRGNDIITGSSGSDVLNGYAGDDVIDGGGGVDSAIFSGTFSAATISYSSANNSFTVRTGAGGIDTVSNVENFVFSDKSVTASSLIVPADTVAPVVSIFGPGSGATSVTIGTNVSLTFNEAIQRGTGNIVLKNSAGNTVATYDAATSGNLSISGSTLTINPTADLDYSTGYKVEFAAGSIKDLAGNGFSGTTTYGFTTLDKPATTTTPAGTISSKIALVSANSGGVMADGGTNSGSDSAPAMSADGRYVIFNSWGGNLVASDNHDAGVTTDFNQDTFYKDMTSQTVSFVVTDQAGGRFVRMGDNSTLLKPITYNGYPAGVSAYGWDFSMSADGRFVAFRTSSNNLVPLTWQADPNSPTGGTINPTTVTSGDININSDVYVKDMSTGTIILASSNSKGLSPGGTLGYGGSNPSISADGRYVAFDSLDGGFVSGDTNRSNDVFVKEIQTGAITRVSTGVGGTQATGSSENPSFSSNGRYLVFQSSAGNLVSGDTNGVVDVFRKDLQTGGIDRVSTSSSGAQTVKTATTYGYSKDAAVSADGRYVVFTSDTVNLVPGDNNATEDVFYKDMQTGVIQLVAVNKSGVAAKEATNQASISDDGRYVVFNSWDEDLVKLAFRHDYGPDVFIKDMQTGEIRIVSEFPLDVASYSLDGRISSDGQYVVLKSSYSADNSINGYQIYRLKNPFLVVEEVKKESASSYSLSDSETALVLTGSGNISGTGNSKANTLTGNSGNNTLSGGAGNDTIDGGGGLNTAAYSGIRSNYSYTVGASNTTISDKVGSEGTDTLTNIQRLKFSDGTLALDVGVWETAGEGYRLYRAAFSRTPDNDGLKYWISQMDSSQTNIQVAHNFIVSNEFKTLYGANPTNGEFITAFYQNVLGRAPDTGGYNYWLDLLNTKKITPEQLLINFSESNENVSLVGATIQQGIWLV